jgi:DNA-directed RNA polymerase subunit beta
MLTVDGQMGTQWPKSYGAAHLLQDSLTVKSDVVGRTSLYESTVAKDNLLKSGSPASFNGLIKELQGLRLEVTIENV